MVSPFTSHIVPRRLSQSRPDPHTLYDIIIVGGGPAGISAARRAHFHKCKYFVFEKGVLANTIDVRYARGKHVLALPESLVLPHDHLSFKAGSKEEVLQQFADCVARHRLQIQTQTEVTGIVQHNGAFEVQTNAGAYRAASVVLAVGRGHLRELDVHDAKLPHVKYTVDNLQEYIGQHILIVGAGDSAANVALMLVEKNRVTIANRSSGFWKMNPSLKNQIDKKVRDQQLTVYHNATVVRIDYGEAVLAVGNEEVAVKADTVIMQMGAEPPKQLLERCGIAFRKVAGSVVPVLKQADSPLEQYKSETMDGVYLIGSLIGGDQIKLAIHQGAAVIDHILGILPLSPGEEQLRHKLACIPGDSVDAKLHYLTACVPLLHAVPRPQLRDIAQESTFHNVGAGHTISLEGTYATALYTIIEGGVELHTHATPSHAIILHQGEVFGEELFSDRPLATSATSVTASLLLAIPRRTLREVMQRVPSLQQELESVQTLHTLRRSLCSDLALAQIHDLATKATRHTFHKDESIFTQGEPAEAFYVLIQGAIALRSRNNEGVEYPITYLEGDAYFGEVELLNTTTNVREATARIASSTCQVLRIRRDDFLTFVHAHPRLKKQMERQSSQRVLQHVVCATRATTAARPVDIVEQLDLASSRDVLLIDETKCIRCNNCVKACAATHQGQPRLNRASGPSLGQIHVPVSCRHCEGTPCLQDCPPGDAIARDADGVVQIVADKCIGCGNCVESCPYKAISLVELSQQETSWVHFTHILDFLRPKKKEKHAEAHRQIAVKCDLCSHSTGGPACVHHCPTGAAIRVKHVDVPATVARLTAQVAFQ